ncbi:unnamed protein product [Caenorhabditis bovis]|uniref:Uncharacterized protein n=1 Tax=Caenorhabditis bovis TaxID=2654633 RepID=A0A8S1F4J1_9PELO|nr:unnamed protein product [Caenorhabditis bovis]
MASILSISRKQDYNGADILIFRNDHSVLALTNLRVVEDNFIWSCFVVCDVRLLAFVVVAVQRHPSALAVTCIDAI